MKILIFISVLFLSSNVSLEDEASPDPMAYSVWDNTSGSVLYIDDMREDGHFHGRYVNNAPGYDCQGVEYRVTGDFFDPLIGFSVVWKAEAETCHTITSWTGELDGNEIRTRWRLVRYGDDGFAAYEGESVFTRRAD